MFIPKWKFVVQCRHKRTFASNKKAMDVVESHSSCEPCKFHLQTELFLTHALAFIYCISNYEEINCGFLFSWVFISGSRPVLGMYLEWRSEQWERIIHVIRVMQACLTVLLYLIDMTNLKFDSIQRQFRIRDDSMLMPFLKFKISSYLRLKIYLPCSKRETSTDARVVWSVLCSDRMDRFAFLNAPLNCLKAETIVFSDWADFKSSNASITPGSVFANDFLGSNKVK